MTDTSKTAIARYVTRCTEMAEGGKYSWWSGLASLISALEAERDGYVQALKDQGAIIRHNIARAEAAEALNATLSTLRETTE